MRRRTDPLSRSSRGRWLAFANDSRGLAYGLLVSAVLVVVASFYPGHLSNDILWMTSQAQTGEISDWHAPLLVWIWHLLAPVGVGVGAVFLAQVATFTLGAYYVLRTVLTRLPAAVATSAVMLFPPVLGPLISVWRDTWMLGGLVAAYGLAGVAIRSVGMRRAVAIAGAGVAALVALASRQNAALALLPLAALAAYVPLAKWRPARRVLNVATAAILSAVICLVAIAGQALMVSLLVKPSSGNADSILYVHDLAGISGELGKNLLPGSVLVPGAAQQIPTAFGHLGVAGLIWGPAPLVKLNGSDDEKAELRAKWIEAIRTHPSAYIQLRVRLMALQLGVSAAPSWVFHPGIDRNDQGLVPAQPRLDRIGTAYLSTLVPDDLSGQPALYRPWVWLLVCMGVAPLLLARSSSVRVVGALAVGVILYQIGLLWLSPGAEYRLESPLVAVAVLALVVAIATLAQRAPRDGSSPGLH